MLVRWIGLVLIASTLLTVSARAQSRPVWRGVDVSMLLELEKAGATYFPDAKSARPADPIRIFQKAGCDWFRIRLFVEPTTDYAKNWGATQDLSQARVLCRRAKAAGGKILLDLHYSDTWADGVHQKKPLAWEKQDFDSLVRTVHDYTRSVLDELEKDDALPDAVQIGNEIAGGILYPDGKLDSGPTEQKQWNRFATLLNAGSRAVREKSTKEHPISVMIHIHGGGQKDVPAWFFSRLLKQQVDFDWIGLSVYPAWGDSLSVLQTNLAALKELTSKPVVIAETAYPAKPIGSTKHHDLLAWPLTPEGQAQFARDLQQTLQQSDDAIGVIWWYGEARPVGKLWVWRDGAEGFFDENGRPRPALSAFGGGR